MIFDRQLRPATYRDFVGGLVWSVKQFQDGGQPPFWKSIYHHISVKNHSIFMKFCTQQQILNWMNVRWSKMKKLHWTDSKFDRTYFLLLLLWCKNWSRQQRHVRTRTWLLQTDHTRQLHTQYVEGISMPNYPVTLKCRSKVTQGHCKRNHWTDHAWLSSNRVIWRWILLWPWNVG